MDDKGYSDTTIEFAASVEAWLRRIKSLYRRELATGSTQLAAEPWATERVSEVGLEVEFSSG